MNDDRDDYTLVPFPCIVSQYCVSHTCVSVSDMLISGLSTVVRSVASLVGLFGKL